VGREKWRRAGPVLASTRIIWNTAITQLMELQVNLTLT